MIPIGFQVAYLEYFVKERAWVLVASVLFLFMGACLVLVPLWQQAGTTSPTELALVFGFGWVVLFQICWMAVILFSPLQQLTRRLVFVVLGVLTLVVLSEISKLNVHQYLSHKGNGHSRTRDARQLIDPTRKAKWRVRDV